MPEGVTIDGRSFAPRLMGQSQRERAWVYMELGRRKAIRDQRYKLYGDGSFYDLKKDPHEQTALGKNADAAALVARARLKWSLSQLK
jgi:arylsulfatase A